MKLALCNEVLGDMPFYEQCSFSKSLGYDGLELAPYTVDETPHYMSSGRRKEIRRIAGDAGTPIAGLHWLLVTPEGLSITTDDKATREKTIDVMLRLIELCADLGGGYLVHGSPGQRRLPDDGDTVEEARKRGIDAWAAIAEDACQAGVVYCIEALAQPRANFVNYLDEAAEIVDQINSPGIRTMIDCSAASQMEKMTVAELIDRWLPSGIWRMFKSTTLIDGGPDKAKTIWRPSSKHSYAIIIPAGLALSHLSMSRMVPRQLPSAPAICGR